MKYSACKGFKPCKLLYFYRGFVIDVPALNHKNIFKANQAAKTSMPFCSTKNASPFASACALTEGIEVYLIVTRVNHTPRADMGLAARAFRECVPVGRYIRSHFIC